MKALRNTQSIIAGVACITSPALLPHRHALLLPRIDFQQVVFPNMGLVKYVGVLLPNLLI